MSIRGKDDRDARKWTFLVATVAGLASPAARAHELWFHSRPGTDPAVVRLTFGDGPDLSAAERVAEIANAKVWAGGKPAGSEAATGRPRGPVAARRGRRGERLRRPRRRDPQWLNSSVIYLAAYAQTRAIEPDQAANLGLGDDQVRLLLFSNQSGPLWFGQPGRESPRQTRPSRSSTGPAIRPKCAPTLTARSLARTCGRDRGRCSCRSWTRPRGSATAGITRQIRYKATLAISPEAAYGPAVAACLARVKEVHGAAGPWVVAGYRIGERALKELGASQAQPRSGSRPPLPAASSVFLHGRWVVGRHRREPGQAQPAHRGITRQRPEDIGQGPRTRPQPDIHPQAGVCSVSRRPSF